VIGRFLCFIGHHKMQDTILTQDEGFVTECSRCSKSYSVERGWHYRRRRVNDRRLNSKAA